MNTRASQELQITRINRNEDESDAVETLGKLRPKPPCPFGEFYDSLRMAPLANLNEKEDGTWNRSSAGRAATPVTSFRGSVRGGRRRSRTTPTRRRCLRGATDTTSRSRPELDSDRRRRPTNVVYAAAQTASRTTTTHIKRLASVLHFKVTEMEPSGLATEIRLQPCVKEKAIELKTRENIQETKLRFMEVSSNETKKTHR